MDNVSTSSPPGFILHAMITSMEKTIKSLEKRVALLEEKEAKRDKRLRTVDGLATFMDGADLRRCRQEAGWTSRELGDKLKPEVHRYPIVGAEDLGFPFPARHAEGVVYHVDSVSLTELIEACARVGVDPSRVFINATSEGGVMSPTDIFVQKK